ncbi:MAG: serine hydroxymethyltransferase [Azospirillum sp.]|nr:serine hydroxymethyltransferase [Azospirillum sp.]HIV07415.1 serine hydroxymethyltransferase [Candidatus Scatocola faecigallinarum]
MKAAVMTADFASLIWIERKTMDFVKDLKSEDKEIFDAIAAEFDRQQNQIELIASENIVSKAVLEAQGSILTNKYAEGYPAKRYYRGCEFVDVVENLAIERAKKLFDARFVNVQPHSGSQANTGVYVALLKPCDTIMGMSLDAGGHLTHGSKVSFSGKWLNSVQYGVCKDTGLIDYDEVERLALENKPKLIIAGGSAYPRQIDFKRFREIADKIGAYLMVDMAHFAGLVAGGVHPNPLEYADVVTTTTHKTLRGPRGGMILTNNGEIAKKINSAIFPGTQGGPLEHVIAAKAVCFAEDLTPQFKKYAAQVVSNARAMGERLKKRGLDLVSGGTDTHLLLVDLRPKGLTGDVVSEAMELAHMTCNKNAIPFDPQPPKVTSGVRVGTPAGTTRGFKEAEFEQVADWMGDVIDALAKGDAAETINKVRKQVIELCRRFPIF